MLKRDFLRCCKDDAPILFEALIDTILRNRERTEMEMRMETKLGTTKRSLRPLLPVREWCNGCKIPLFYINLSSSFKFEFNTRFFLFKPTWCNATKKQQVIYLSISNSKFAKRCIKQATGGHLGASSSSSCPSSIFLPLNHWVCSREIIAIGLCVSQLKLPLQHSIVRFIVVVGARII